MWYLRAARPRTHLAPRVSSSREHGDSRLAPYLGGGHQRAGRRFSSARRQRGAREVRRGARHCSARFLRSGVDSSSHPRCPPPLLTLCTGAAEGFALGTTEQATPRRQVDSGRPRHAARWKTREQRAPQDPGRGEARHCSEILRVRVPRVAQGFLSLAWATRAQLGAPPLLPLPPHPPPPHPAGNHTHAPPSLLTPPYLARLLVCLPACPRSLGIDSRSLVSLVCSRSAAQPLREQQHHPLVD